MKTALVVGGTSGIGLGIAKILSIKNIDTYVIGRRAIKADSNDLDKIAFLQFDLSKLDSIANIKNFFLRKKIDYVIYSVATEEPLKKFFEVNSGEYDYAFLLNLKIPFFLTKALLNNFNQNARLLFLTSRLSVAPEEGSLVYCMTKSAIEIFSLGISKELKGTILSSTIIPGVVDTEMQKRLREANPILFPHAHRYQEMRPKLQPVTVVSKAIVSHLCDTSDAEFSNHRVTVADIKSKI